MPSGGWRPGAGRPRKEPVEPKPKRPVGRPRKAKSDEAPKQPVGRPNKELATLSAEVEASAAIENLTAVEFMKREMNNSANSLQHRIQLAQLLAPYESPKIDSVKSGKKDQQAAKAGEVIKGTRFGQSQPPRLVTGS